MIICALVYADLAIQFSVSSRYNLCLSLLSHFQYVEDLHLPECFQL